MRTQTNLNSLNNLTRGMVKGVNAVRKNCVYCGHETNITNIKRHEKACGENPLNKKECPVCRKIYSKKSQTCSYSCSNTFFRSNKNNPNYNPDRYTTICWEHHGKKCLVCGENKIVAVHHVNKQHNDNRPENLVPLCPTHHQYMHSKHKHLIENIVKDYLIKYSERGSLADH